MAMVAEVRLGCFRRCRLSTASERMRSAVSFRPPSNASLRRARSVLAASSADSSQSTTAASVSVQINRRVRLGGVMERPIYSQDRAKSGSGEWPIFLRKRLT